MIKISTSIIAGFLVHMKFYLAVHHFHARVQSSPCTTYGKYLLESIMAVLTPKSSIRAQKKLTVMLMFNIIKKLSK